MYWNVRIIVELAVILAIASCAGVAGAQPPEYWATLEGRFDFVCSRIVGSDRRIKVRRGVENQAKFLLLACSQECQSANVLRITDWGCIERSSLYANPLAASFSDTVGIVRRRLSDKDLATLEAVTADPPAAADPMPPVERRLLLAWRTEDGWKQRIYDRANLPDKGRQLLNAIVPASSREQFGTWVRRVNPLKSISIGKPSLSGRFTVSPDGQTLVYVHAKGLKVFDTTLRQVQSPTIKVEGGVRYCEFSRDGSFFAFECGGRRIVVLDPRDWTKITELVPAAKQFPVFRERLKFSFSPKADSLTVWDTAGPVVIDTRRWTPAVKQLPAGTSWYRQSPDEAIAVVSDKDHAISLWNCRQDKLIRKIADQCYCLMAKFSPDGKMLALLTANTQQDDAQKSSISLRVWNTQDGSLRTELFPYGMPWTFEHSETPNFLRWTNDSKYLLAVSTPRGFPYGSRLHMWNVPTGRHCVDFRGRYTTLVGIGIGNDGKTVFAADKYGALEAWSLTPALR